MPLPALSLIWPSLRRPWAVSSLPALASCICWIRRYFNSSFNVSLHPHGSHYSDKTPVHWGPRKSASCRPPSLCNAVRTTCLLTWSLLILLLRRSPLHYPQFGYFSCYYSAPTHVTSSGTPSSLLLHSHLTRLGQGLPGVYLYNSLNLIVITCSVCHNAFLSAVIPTHDFLPLVEYKLPGRTKLILLTIIPAGSDINIHGING